MFSLAERLHCSIYEVYEMDYITFTKWFQYFKETDTDSGTDSAKTGAELFTAMSALASPLEQGNT